MSARFFPFITIYVKAAVLYWKKCRCNILLFFRCLGTDIKNMLILDDLFSNSFHLDVILLKSDNFMGNYLFPHFFSIIVIVNNELYLKMVNRQLFRDHSFRALWCPLFSFTEFHHKTTLIYVAFSTFKEYILKLCYIKHCRNI